MKVELQGVFFFIFYINAFNKPIYSDAHCVLFVQLCSYYDLTSILLIPISYKLVILFFGHSGKKKFV